MARTPETKLVQNSQTSSICENSEKCVSCRVLLMTTSVREAPDGSVQLETPRHGPLSPGSSNMLRIHRKESVSFVCVGSPPILARQKVLLGGAYVCAIVHEATGYRSRARGSMAAALDLDFGAVSSPFGERFAVRAWA